MAAPLHFAVRGASNIDTPHVGFQGNNAGPRPVGSNYSTVIAALLEAGANVDILDERGHTPLHRACNFGDTRIVQQLLEAGADTGKVDRNGWPPARHAAMAGQYHIAKLLADN